MSLALATRGAVQPQAGGNRFMPSSDLNDEEARQYFLMRATEPKIEIWANNHESAINEMRRKIGLREDEPLTTIIFAKKGCVLFYCETDKECVYPPPEKPH